MVTVVPHINGHDSKPGRKSSLGHLHFGMEARMESCRWFAWDGHDSKLWRMHAVLYNNIFQLRKQTAGVRGTA
jgi:hypothetical protein